VEAAHGADGPGDEAKWLARFRDVRVYYPRANDAEALEMMVGRTFVGDCRVEMCRAELCRAELLVEIEGVASLAARS
jgi:hypothetical protein